MYVFAYGSLMWNPGFPHDEAFAALAPGWRRSWCVRSTVYRGTPETPGLVLGLVRGGSCVGTAYRVNQESEAQACAYLDRREMAEAGYRREEIEILLPCGLALALCYVADRPREANCDELAVAVSQASGLSGRNFDYMQAALMSLRAIAAPPGWPQPCAGLPDGGEALMAAVVSGRNLQMA